MDYGKVSTFFVSSRISAKVCLQSFYTEKVSKKTGKRIRGNVKFEYIRTRLFRSLKRSIRLFQSKGNFGLGGVASHSASQSSALMMKIKELCRSDSRLVSSFADTRQGPSIDSLHSSPSPLYKTYNNKYLTSIFSHSLLRDIYLLYIDLSFQETDLNTLCRNWKMHCCEGKHTLECQKHWEEFRMLLGQEAEIHVNDAHVFKEVQTYRRESEGKVCRSESFIQLAAIIAMCLFDPTAMSCGHPLCLQASMQALNMPDTGGLCALIALQGRALTVVVQQGEVIASILDRLGKALVQRQRTETTSHSEPWRRSAHGREDFMLVLDSTLRLPVLRESSFPLAGYLGTVDGRLSSHFINCRLQVALYTVDEPPRLLTHNISGRVYKGKSILKGSVQTKIGSDGRFIFPKVVINEVSSHYLDDEFTLVVTAETPQVRPAVFRHVTVRARKKLHRRNSSHPCLPLKP